MKLKGSYTITDGDGNIVASDNVITSLGEELIIRFMGKKADDWAAKFAIGGGGTAAATSDTSLEYPYNHVATESFTINTTDKSVTARTTLEGNVAGVIYEVGVYNLELNPNQPVDFIQLANFTLTSVESNANITVDNTNNRMGPESINLNATSDGVTAKVQNLNFDLNGFDVSDGFTFGYYIKDANAADIEIRFMNNANDYYKYNFTPSTTTGFHIENFLKSDMTAVASGSWNGITEIQVIVKATGATTTDVVVDGLIVKDKTAHTDYGLVSRSVLDTPVTKAAGQDYEITYTVEFVA